MLHVFTLRVGRFQRNTRRHQTAKDYTRGRRCRAPGKPRHTPETFSIAIYFVAGCAREYWVKLIFHENFTDAAVGLWQSGGHAETLPVFCVIWGPAALSCTLRDVRSKILDLSESSIAVMCALAAAMAGSGGHWRHACGCFSLGRVLSQCAAAARWQLRAARTPPPAKSGSSPHTAPPPQRCGPW